MADARVVCMCGMDLGYRIADFILSTGVETAFVINDEETTGQWYRSPLELGIRRIKQREVVPWKPDLIITAYYHRILPESVFGFPRLGAWNLHLGDAERYRGAYPSIRALINGDDTYGVTLHRIDSGTDTGDILEKLMFPIPQGFNGRDLYYLMVEKGVELFKGQWDFLLSGEALGRTRPQNGARAETMHRKDLSHVLRPGEEFMNRVRALTFPPFPPPYFTCSGRRYLVTEDKEDGRPD
jgi:methionyl-tRNA formyltransferase